MKKYSTDFTSMSLDVQDKITTAVEELNCTPILICRASNHPEDNYLWVVIGQYTKPNPFGEYCVWTANVSRNEASLFYGHYGVSFKSALQIANEKIRDLNKEEC